MYCGVFVSEAVEKCILSTATCVRRKYVVCNDAGGDNDDNECNLRVRIASSSTCVNTRREDVVSTRPLVSTVSKQNQHSVECCTTNVPTPCVGIRPCVWSLVSFNFWNKTRSKKYKSTIYFTKPECRTLYTILRSYLSALDLLITAKIVLVENRHHLLFFSFLYFLRSYRENDFSAQSHFFYFLYVVSF